MYEFWQTQSGAWGMMPWVTPLVWIILLPLLVWSIVWKGLALWRAAQRQEVGWFVAILILNTLGILEILYLYFFSKAAPKHPDQR